MKDTRQGCYLIVTRAGRLYVGSVAGGAGRSFTARWAEHAKDLARGTHPNDGLRRDGADGLRFIPLAVVKKGDIRAARRIEGIIIKALGKAVCNERR